MAPRANATDKAQIRRARRRAERNQERYDDALREVMRSPAGQIVLWELLSGTGLWKTMVRDGFDAGQVMFNSGKHSHGLRILADLQRVDLEAYIELERVNRAYARSEEQQEEAAQTPSAGEAITEGDTE